MYYKIFQNLNYNKLSLVFVNVVYCHEKFNSLFDAVLELRRKELDYSNKLLLDMLDSTIPNGNEKWNNLCKCLLITFLFQIQKL